MTVYCLRLAGTCRCYAGFTGAVCELSLNHVPVLRDIPQNGSCDIQTRPCQETPVQGDYFIKSEKLSCTIRSYTVLLQLINYEGDVVGNSQ